MHRTSDIILISIFISYFKDDITRIQCIFGLKIFQTNNLTFVASEVMILFLHCEFSFSFFFCHDFFSDEFLTPKFSE